MLFLTKAEVILASAWFQPDICRDNRGCSGEEVIYGGRTVDIRTVALTLLMPSDCALQIPQSYFSASTDDLTSAFGKATQDTCRGKRLSTFQNIR